MGETEVLRGPTKDGTSTLLPVFFKTLSRQSVTNLTVRSVKYQEIYILLTKLLTKEFFFAKFCKFFVVIFIMSGSGKSLLGVWLYKRGESWAVKEGSPLHKSRDVCYRRYLISKTNIKMQQILLLNRN